MKITDLVKSAVFNQETGELIINFRFKESKILGLTKNDRYSGRLYFK